MKSTRNFLWLALIAVSACNQPSPSTNTPNVAPSTGSSGPTGATGAASCIQILTCVSACSDTAKDCATDCYGQGSPTGQTQVLAILQCDKDHSCSGDSTCLGGNCAAEVNACGGTAATGSTGPAAQSDGFDAGIDNWSIAGDAQSTSVVPDYNGTGGNPGGLISANDDVTGGTWYFVAPQKYLGNQSTVAGKTLQYDLKTTTISSPFGNYDVVLKGGGIVIAYNTSPDPNTAWTHYSVPLSASGWKTVSSEYATEVPDPDFAALTDTTPTEFATVLSSLTLLRIRGEFNTGADTGALDNVRWGAP